MVSREGTKRTSVKIYGAQISPDFRNNHAQSLTEVEWFVYELPLELLYVPSAYGSEACETQCEPPIGCICYTMETRNYRN